MRPSNPTKNPQPKPVHFIGSSLKDVRDFPPEVQRVIGFGLHLAQIGQKHDAAVALQGFGGASVLEIRDNFQTDTYRAVYTVRFAKAIYVLHSFQKKSHRGIATDPQDLRLIQQRLAAAAKHYRENYEKEPK